MKISTKDELYVWKDALDSKENEITEIDQLVNFEDEKQNV